MKARGRQAESKADLTEMPALTLSAFNNHNGQPAFDRLPRENAARMTVLDDYSGHRLPYRRGLFTVAIDILLYREEFNARL